MGAAPSINFQQKTSRVVPVVVPIKEALKTKECTEKNIKKYKINEEISMISKSCKQLAVSFRNKILSHDTTDPSVVTSPSLELASPENDRPSPIRKNTTPAIMVVLEGGKETKHFKIHAESYGDRGLYQQRLPPRSYIYDGNLSSDWQTQPGNHRNAQWFDKGPVQQLKDDFNYIPVKLFNHANDEDDVDCVEEIKA